MNLREHIGSLHANLHDLRSLADRIDAELTTKARRQKDHYAPTRWPGASLDGLSVVLRDGPLLCGANEVWHEHWHQNVLASKEPIALALLAEYDKRYAALQLGCELELEVVMSTSKPESARAIRRPRGEPQVADHEPPSFGPDEDR